MHLSLNLALAKNYKSQSQKIRVLTEDWVGSYAFCPSCGYSISVYGHNKPVADFYCFRCSEDFELKSKRNALGEKVVDGAYGTMIKRLQSSSNPNLFLLHYSAENLDVENFFIIPKHFFVPEIIERRKPLSQNARRAGWIGCNILLRGIPNSGKVFFIKNKRIEPKNAILLNWSKTLFLREPKNYRLKGWIMDVMCYIDRLGGREFSLKDMYNFENELRTKYPDNRHVKDKIRQQLQFLRDKGYLEFIGKGIYRKT